MKGTDQFKNTIEIYLKNRAELDELFAETLKKENKNIDDCITYILNQVQKSGCNGFDDEEIFGMAAHYYDEDDLKPGAKINAKVVVNHKVEITKHDKAAIKRKDLYETVASEKTKLTTKKTTKKEVAQSEQISLFG